VGLPKPGLRILVDYPTTVIRTVIPSRSGDPVVVAAFSHKRTPLFNCNNPPIYVESDLRLACRTVSDSEWPWLPWRGRVGAYGALRHPWRILLGGGGWQLIYLPMSSPDWFTTLDREESQPRSTLTPPGAPMYFRLRALSHSPETVHLANQINLCPGLPEQMRYDFLQHSGALVKRRNTGWARKAAENEADLALVMEAYNLNAMLNLDLAQSDAGREGLTFPRPQSCHVGGRGFEPRRPRHLCSTFSLPFQIFAAMPLATPCDINRHQMPQYSGRTVAATVALDRWADR
jgi:hypothetical protein